MSQGDAPRRRENAFTLMRRLVSGSVALVKLEIQRGRQEMARNLAELKGGVIRLAIAAALGLVFLIGFIGFVMAVLVVIGLWWVALIILVLLLMTAGLLAWNGFRRVTSTKYTPEETIASVKEEIAWAKNRLLRRG